MENLYKEKPIRVHNIQHLQINGDQQPSLNHSLDSTYSTYQSNSALTTCKPNSTCTTSTYSTSKCTTYQSSYQFTHQSSQHNSIIFSIFAIISLLSIITFMANWCSFFATLSATTTYFTNSLTVLA